MAYQKILKPILFRFDPERVHDWFVAIGKVLGDRRLGRWVVSRIYGYHRSDAGVEIDGVRYRTPVVLAAGFDYNGQLTRILPHVAFGGVEVGSVTARRCEGNPKPRLTRLIRSKSLLVSKGLRNEGSEAIIRRLRAIPPTHDFVVGVSIARTNDAEAVTLEDGIADYVTTLRRVMEADVADYVTINISCPNVHGGESFADPERLGLLLDALNEVGYTRPLYLKMPIDQAWPDFARLLAVAERAGVRGLVIGNLNKKYSELDFPDEAPAEFRGGVSGKPCRERSNDLIRRTRQAYGRRFTIIGCGGILSAEDALEKFRAGADLLQLISGMIFEGPHLMKEIAAAFAASREGLAAAQDGATYGELLTARAASAPSAAAGG